MIPVQEQTFPAFLGDNDAQATIPLPTLYSPGGSQNVWIDKLGRMKAVSGYTRINAALVTGSGAGAAVLVRALYGFRVILSGSATRQLLALFVNGTDADLRYSTDGGATWSLISALGASYVGSVPDWCLFGNTLYLALGVGSARTWDGSTFGVASSTQLVAPSVVSGGDGPLSGSYTVKIIPVLTDGRVKAGSETSTPVQIQGARLNYTWTADTDVATAGYYIARTTGTGADFYIVTYVSGRLTVSYDGDAVPDPDLITHPALSNHGDPPPTDVRYGVAHKGRVWWIGTPEFPRRAWYSDPGEPTSVYTDHAYLDQTDQDSLGDVSTGGTGEFDGMLVIWLERSVWTISGTGNVVGAIVDWNRRRTSARVGTVSSRTVIRVPAGAVYTDQKGNERRTDGNRLAYLTPLGDVRLFDGDADEIISWPKQDTFARLVYAQRSKCFAYEDIEHGEYVWVIPIDADTEPTMEVAWNYRWGTWHERPTRAFGHVTAIDSASDAMILVAGSNSVGRVFTLWNGTSLDGAAFTVSIMTKPVFPVGDGGGASGGGTDYARQRRGRWLSALFESMTVPATVLVEALPFDAADDAAASDYSGSVSSDDIERVELQDSAGRYIHSRGFRFRFSSTSSTAAAWTLNAFILGFQVLKGLKRIGAGS